MGFNFLKAAFSVILLVIEMCPLALHGQASESHSAKAKEAVEPNEHPLFYPDAEFVGSTKFRDATLVLPTWRKLNFEAHYFGDDTHDLGLTGGSWTFEFLNKIMLAPGMAVGFGSSIETSPVATLRWGAEHSWVVAEGFSAFSLRQSFVSEDEPNENTFLKRAYISDGNHLSARWKRMEGGFSWEHIATREENEWKTGGRFDLALNRRLNFVAYILAPDTEFRGGLRFRPPEKER